LALGSGRLGARSRALSAADSFSLAKGPAAEIAAHKIWGSELLPAGPTLYRMGLTFSVGLAPLPSLIVCLDWGFGLCARSCRSPAPRRGPAVANGSGIKPISI
jgi:hypothetical protein